MKYNKGNKKKKKKKRKQEKKMFLLNWISDLLIGLSVVISIASILSTLTPSEKDDKWIGKLYGYLDLIALNFKIKK